MSENPQNQDPANDSATLETPENEVAALRSRLAEAETEVQAARETHLRAMADLENTRRRLERDAQTSLKYASEKLLGELLPVCDSFELGLKAAAEASGAAKAMGEGMELTFRQLMSVLEKHGVKQVDPAGQPFNPDFHQAMSMIETADVAANHVVNVMQKGYTLHERLLRPAMVIVAKAPSEPAA